MKKNEIPCHFCGEPVNIKNLKQRIAHFRVHVKNGIADEVRTPGGNLLFVKGTGETRGFE